MDNPTHLAHFNIVFFVKRCVLDTYLPQRRGAGGVVKKPEPRMLNITISPSLMIAILITLLGVILIGIFPENRDGALEFAGGKQLVVDIAFPQRPMKVG